MNNEDEPASNFEVNLRYDETLRKQLEDGSTDPLCWVDGISADGTHLSGGPNSDGMKEYVTSLLGGLLQSIPSLMNGEKSIIRTGNGPIFIAVEPVDDNKMNLAFCYAKETAESPELREEYEPSARIDLSAFARGVIETAQEFHEYVRDINPDLTENPDFRGIREDIAGANTALAERFDSSE